MFWLASTWDDVPHAPFSWMFDSRTGAVVGRNWFSLSEGIFISVTGSVLTRLKRKIAAVVGGRE